MSDMSKFVAALIGLLLMAMVAGRQLFLFSVDRSQQGFLGFPGGRYHLWFAFGASLTACVAAGLMFHFFLRHERNRWSPKPQIGTATNSDSPSNNPETAAPFDAIRWAQLNPWLEEGQADDRRPMDGSVAESGGTPSTKSAFARRSHQVMFKKWSQARHD